MALIAENLPWLVALAALLALLGVIRSRAPRRKAPPAPLPDEWDLSARPVFSTDERRVYRQLREALPHHIILAKLPMVRFCHPNDPDDVRYWYELLGSTYVSFAVCSANGRVLAAIDLESERGNARRAQQIKQSVLSACRIRYLRCPVDHFPSVPELQLLVPHSGAARGPQPAPVAQQTRDTPTTGVASRRAQRTALWQDSSFFQDSFFAPDSREDTSFPASEFSSSAGSESSPLNGAAEPSARRSRGPDDTGGPADNPGRTAPSTRH